MCIRCRNKEASGKTYGGWLKDLYKVAQETREEEIESWKGNDNESFYVDRAMNLNLVSKVKPKYLTES